MVPKISFGLASTHKPNGRISCLSIRTILWGWIGGPVILTSKNSMGFYFDPNQTIAAEVTAEGLQTSLDQIEANPSQFVPGPNFSMVCTSNCGASAVKAQYHR